MFSYARFIISRSRDLTNISMTFNLTLMSHYSICKLMSSYSRFLICSLHDINQTNTSMTFNPTFMWHYLCFLYRFLISGLGDLNLANISMTFNPTLMWYYLCLPNVNRIMTPPYIFTC